MGALPKRRISSQRRGKRRAGHAVPLKNLVACKQCGEQKRPHFACGNCGSAS